MNSYILYKLTAGHPKTRLEFIKDVIDSLASDYEEIHSVHALPPPPLTNFQKGGLDRTSIFREGLLGKRGWLFSGGGSAIST